MKNEAIFAAGCFWGVEEKFRTTPGVIDTEVGYIGGNIEKPSYEQVCTDRTGHAEAVRVTFDSEKITYKELLDIFWNLHDPTQLDRQGPDIGTQYRSAIFTLTPEQARAAAYSKEALEKSGKYNKPIATKLVSGTEMQFYPAEEYHQKYLMKRGLGTCEV